MRGRTVESVVILALSLLCVPLIATKASQAQRLYRIGYLAVPSPAATLHLLEALHAGLREHGYVEGQNLVIEYRWVEGTSQRFDELAGDLVRAKVELILAWGTPAAVAAKQATSTVPIIFLAVGDPVGSGIVASLARPGGNVTGVTNLSAELSAKQLELLKEIVPGLTQIAVLRNPRNPVSAPQLQWTELAAQSLGVRLQVVDVRDPSEFEAAFLSMTRERAGALIVLADTMFLSQRRQIADLAVKHRLPATFNWREYAEAGGLIAYGPRLADQWRRVTEFADKILKGVRPAELPVEQPMRFELVINLKTAKELGLTISPLLRFRADEVLE
ncbi:MAG TPA: ABC transporter substrate-binding protein [Candidatus Tectomicrobia bacterium]|nr:ABC transporter substrate-binding protein [Candidatus Tectomicrobia bacterium]